MVLKGYPRISETFISNEILLLEQLGFQIHILSMRQPRERFSHASVKQIQARVDYLPETLLVPLPRFLYHNLLLALDRPRRYARAVKLAARRIRRTRRMTTIKHLFQAGYLVHKLLPQSGITHLHAHFAHSPTSVTMFASLLSGLPFSFTAHAKDIYTSDPAQLAEKIAQARFVVTCTGYNRQFLRNLAPGADTPVHRIYHGIDVRLFNGLTVNGRPRPPYRLLTVARLTTKKGLPTVLKALRILKDQGVVFQHDLIGDGDDRDVIIRLIDALGLSACCQWHGTQPHDVVLKHYKKADVFLLGCEIAPDGDRDGIPNVLLESMAMGVPVVSTQVSAIPELVQDGHCGLLVPPQDPQALAAAVNRLLTDTDLRQQIITGGKARVAQAFDNQTLIKDLAAVLRQV